MSGVHFFVMKNIPELQRLVIKEGIKTKPLITRDSTVYVIKDLTNVIKVTKYGDGIE